MYAPSECVCGSNTKSNSICANIPVHLEFSNNVDNNKNGFVCANADALHCMRSHRIVHNILFLCYCVCVCVRIFSPIFSLDFCSSFISFFFILISLTLPLSLLSRRYIVYACKLAGIVNTHTHTYIRLFIHLHELILHIVRCMLYIRKRGVFVLLLLLFAWFFYKFYYFAQQCEAQFYAISYKYIHM